VQTREPYIDAFMFLCYSLIMSDILFSDSISLEAYKEFVITERRNDEPLVSDWDTQRADLIITESLEFMCQHGSGNLLLLPHQLGGEKLVEKLVELKNAMAGELGDMLWFDFDIAANHGLDPGQLCVDALKTHVDTTPDECRTFGDVQSLVMEHADTIKVMNKRGLLNPELPKQDKYVTLDDDPFYIFMRMQLRLIRTLKQESTTLGPLSAAELEPLQELNIAVGDHILVLAYLSKARLGWNIEDIARYNVYKLRHRKIFGKSSGSLIK